MFSKQHRLAKTRDIQKVRAAGRSFFSPYFAVKMLKRSEAVPRFTVIIGTKTEKKATARNRMRRIVRETIRLRMAQVVPADYMITIRGGAKQLNGKQLSEALVTFLTSIKVLRHEDTSHYSHSPLPKDTLTRP